MTAPGMPLHSTAPLGVRGPGLARRLPILLGGLAGYALYAILTNGFGLGKPVDFTTVANAAWIGLPQLTFPVFDAQAIALIAPVAIVLVAENLGHVKAVAAMTGMRSCMVWSPRVCPSGTSRTATDTSALLKPCR